MLRPLFLQGCTGRIHLTNFLPDTPTNHWLLFCPPWAEEMNKSRRMMARLGHALADQGIAMCLPDLYGTGDSAGDFSDARWDIWCDDLRQTSQWLQQQGCRRLLLGGLRSGCLLAWDVRQTLALAPASSLFWQPVSQGAQQLTQFLRLRMAAGMTRGGGESVRDLRALLTAGKAIEVAGYELAPALADALEQKTLQGADDLAGETVYWLELGSGEQQTVSPVSRQVIEDWRSRGARVSAQRLSGDPFWSTQELVDVPALIDASVAVLTGEA